MKVIGVILLVLVVAFTVFEVVGLIRDFQAKKKCKNKDDNTELKE